MRWRFWRRKRSASQEDLAAATQKNVAAIADLYAAVDGLLARRMRREAQIVDNVRRAFGAPAEGEPPEKIQTLLERLKEVEHDTDQR